MPIRLRERVNKKDQKAQKIEDKYNEEKIECYKLLLKN